MKTGGTVDRVNYQLDKLDTVTDSAVSMADSADTAVRAVSTAISKPVEKVSGLDAPASRTGSPRSGSEQEHVGRDGRGQGRRAAARAGPRGGSPRRRADAAVERAADPDADADPDAEARPVAAAGADAEARPGANPARRASLIQTGRGAAARFATTARGAQARRGRHEVGTKS